MKLVTLVYIVELFLVSTCTCINALDVNSQRIHCHLILGDSASAIEEAYLTLNQHPENPICHQNYIKALAAAGDERHLCHAWQRYSNLFPDDALSQRDLPELMAWGVIDSGARSASPIVRLTAQIAAFLGNDAKSVAILLAGARDSNAAVREVAVKLMGRMHDQSLAQELLKLFSAETNWLVRIQVIKSLGSMRVNQAQNSLKAIVANPKTRTDERLAAIESLVMMLDEISRTEIISLAHSDRSGLRQLACEVISHTDSQRDIDLLWELANDPCGTVRAEALRSIGLVAHKSDYERYDFVGLARKRSKDSNAIVAITAAWLLVIHEPDHAEELFAPWLCDELPEIRWLAAAALASSGIEALKQSWRTGIMNEDPFVRINIAMGMIQQRMELDTSCEILYKELMTNTKTWMLDEKGLFSTLTPCGLEQCEDQFEGPEAGNQLIRLELLNMLAVVKYSKSQEAIQHFLEQRKWGISGLAAALLLSEGDESALQMIEKIMDQPGSPLKTQAALILALWGRDETAIAALEEGYLSSDRETKERILEAVGHIGADRSIPFLLKRLDEPQQTLRLIAAAALLQCLYH